MADSFQKSIEGTFTCNLETEAEENDIQSMQGSTETETLAGKIAVKQLEWFVVPRWTWYRPPGVCYHSCGSRNSASTESLTAECTNISYKCFSTNSA